LGFGAVKAGRDFGGAGSPSPSSWGLDFLRAVPRGRDGREERRRCGPLLPKDVAGVAVSSSGFCCLALVMRSGAVKAAVVVDRFRLREVLFDDMSPLRLRGGASVLSLLIHTVEDSALAKTAATRCMSRGSTAIAAALPHNL